MVIVVKFAQHKHFVIEICPPIIVVVYMCSHCFRKIIDQYINIANSKNSQTVIPIQIPFNICYRFLILKYLFIHLL